MSTKSTADKIREANSGRTVILPVSGVEVRIKSVHLPTMVARGVMPSELLRQALAGFPDLEPKDGENKLADALMQVYNFECAVLKSALVDPMFVDDDDQTNGNTITYSDLIPEDKDVIIGICQQPITRWERFLSEQRERLHAVRDSENDSAEAE